MEAAGVESAYTAELRALLDRIRKSVDWPPTGARRES
jgi:hypothetical protein